MSKSNLIDNPLDKPASGDKLITNPLDKPGAPDNLITNPLDKAEDAQRPDEQASEPLLRGTRHTRDR